MDDCEKSSLSRGKWPDVEERLHLTEPKDWKGAVPDPKYVYEILVGTDEDGFQEIHWLNDAEIPYVHEQIGVHERITRWTLTNPTEFTVDNIA